MSEYLRVKESLVPLPVAVETNESGRLLEEDSFDIVTIPHPTARCCSRQRHVI